MITNLEVSLADMYTGRTVEVRLPYPCSFPHARSGTGMRHKLTISSISPERSYVDIATVQGPTRTGIYMIAGRAADGE